MNSAPKLLEPIFVRLERLFGWNRNYLYGVLNGWFASLGDGFFNQSIVLSSFAASLGASNILIGALPAITVGGWLLPQLLVASKIRHLPRKVVVYQKTAFARAAVPHQRDVPDAGSVVDLHGGYPPHCRSGSLQFPVASLACGRVRWSSAPPGRSACAAPPPRRP